MTEILRDRFYVDGVLAVGASVLVPFGRSQDGLRVSCRVLEVAVLKNHIQATYLQESTLNSYEKPCF